MTPKEKQIYESIAPVVNLYWVPGTWFISALDTAVKQGFMKNHPGNKLIMEVCKTDKCIQINTDN